MFTVPAPWVIAIAELCWSIVHGCPAIIYLTMNKTIRTEFLKFLKLKKTNKVNNATSFSNMNTSKSNFL